MDIQHQSNNLKNPTQNKIKIRNFNHVYTIKKNGCQICGYNDDVEKLAQIYFEHFKFPLKSLRDAFHMAFAVYYELDFLLTWNCKHLANANIRLELARFNFTLGYKTPDICTPEELNKITTEE